MPYNILLLPLLAGFVLVSRARIFCYATSQLEKEHLLMWASLAGLVLLFTSRFICVMVIDWPLGQFLLTLKQTIAPFPYMGTAVGTLILSLLLVWSINCLIPESEVGLWLYHAQKFNQLESILLSSVIGISPAGRMSYGELFFKQLKLSFLRLKKRINELKSGKKITGGYSCFPAGDPMLVMVTTSDNKVYVGFVSQLPPVIASRIEYLRILPVWSGYRDSSRKVHRTTSYADALLAADDKNLMIKVVPAKEIVAVGLYIDGVFPEEDIDPALTEDTGLEEDTNLASEAG